ncbi:20626_t:CDS:10 [Cetraspora pellucida]|uniref:20626_t:CDS:1 n=1 Tax=Cetraspora pellucida TaxID=1433469 RepID=A0A9N9HGB6_9GLOM|nr:20626_t:CDS:10 [Cetraspora pellucida]
MICCKHYSFNLACPFGEVVASFDINLIANATYKHNFGKTPVTKGIDFLSVNDIERYDANCWLMSPPCQPYTRGGKGLDDQDPRAKGLLHLIDVLPKLSNPPDYIFLENVLNFEKSKSREKLITQICLMNYEIHECLLTPLQFGIPNDRLRYYLMARKISTFNKSEKVITSQKYFEQAMIYTSWPFECMLNNNKENNKCHHWKQQQGQQPLEFNVPELNSYIESCLDEKELKKYLVPEKNILKSFNFKFDIVRPTDKRCSCFTKSYGSHHVFGSGSLIQTKNLEFTDYEFENPKSLLELGLRYFTPLEIAKLHAFPSKSELSKSPNRKNENRLDSFNNNYAPKLFNDFELMQSSNYLEFPDDISLIQKYRLLGNSLNVFVVSELLRCVLFNLQVWICGLFMPEAFITATRQAVAQKHKWSLEELVLEIALNKSGDPDSFVLTGFKLEDTFYQALNGKTIIWVFVQVEEATPTTEATINLPVYLNEDRSDLLFIVNIESKSY